VTLIVTVHELPAAIEPPLRLTLPPFAAVVSVPPHVFDVVSVPVFVTPDGYVSENATPVNALFKFGLVMVKVSVDVPPVRIGFGENNFVMLGALNTVSDAVALPVDPEFVPPFVEEMNPLTF
jgi:hypothetical protein